MDAEQGIVYREWYGKARDALHDRIPPDVSIEMQLGIKLTIRRDLTRDAARLGADPRVVLEAVVDALTGRKPQW